MSANNPATGHAEPAAARRSQWLAYVAAVLVSLLTLGIRLQLAPWMGTRPTFIIFFIPILISAYLGGLGPGLVATAIAAAGVDYYLVQPVHDFRIAHAVDFVQWLLLIVGGGLASLLTEALHRARRRANVSQQLNAVTLASIGDAVITTDAQGRVTFLNGEAEKLTGWKHAAAIGLPLATVFRIINEQTREPVEDPVNKAFRTGKVVELANHTMLIARDGRERIIDDSAAPIRQADGKIAGVVLVFRDNTEKKRAEDAVRMSEKQLRLYAEHIPAAVAMLDRDMNYLVASARWMENFRLGSQSIIGRNHYEIFPEIPQRWKEIHQRCLAGAVERCDEEPFPRADGRTDWLRWEVRPWHKGDGTIGGIIIFSEDITTRKQAADELRRNTQFLQQTGHMAKVGGWEFDPATGAGQWSEEVARIHDLPPDTKPNKELGFSFYHGESRARIEAAVKLAMEQGTPYDLELEIVSAKGIHKWVRTIGQPVMENGQVARVCGVLQDITERRRMQADLEETNALYHSLVEQMPAGIFRKDAEGRYVFVNDYFCQLRHATPESFLGKLPEELPPAEAAFKAQAAGHHAEIMQTGRTIEVLDEYHRADGQTLFFHVVKTPVFNAEGKITGSQGILLNVTELQIAQIRYREQHALLRTLIDLAPDFIFVKDETVRYLVVNEALAKCYGRPAAEILGRTDADLLPAELAARFRAGEIQTMAAESPRMFEDTITYPDGQRRVVETNMVAFRDSQGKVGGLVGIGRDITAQKAAEQALRESEARLSTIFHSSPVGIVITRFSDGKILEANEMFATIHGRTLAEIIGKTSPDLGLWADLKQREQMLNILNAEGRCKDMEIKFQRKDGTEGDLLVSTEIIQLAGEKCMLGLARDFTERKHAETQLIRLAAIVESCDDAIISKTLEGIITSWNRGAELIFGYPSAEAIGQPLLMLLPPERQHEEAEILARIARGENVIHFETVRVRKDGQRIDVSVTISPLKDAGGKITGASKIARDITGQKRTAEKIAREQARFKLIFDSVPIGIAFHTAHPDGSFTRNINDAHLRICGLTRQQHDEPEIYRRITHPDDRVIQQQFSDQVNAGLIKQFSLEKRYLHPDGKTVWVNFSYQREIYPDGTIEELTTVVDITELKRLEEQLRQSQKMEAIGQLSGGVAHDFNNILTAILGNATLLSDPEAQPAEVQESAAEIIRATHRAADLTRQLLLFSRRQAMQPATVDLNHIVSQSMKMLHRILGEDITILSEFAPGLPPVFADGGMMEQVVLNLAVNSRDAMPSGGRLNIRTSTETVGNPEAPAGTEARPHVCLTVTDNGSGIPPEVLPRIFEPFFTTKDVGKGTGLGLATVYGIVRQHNGWITVSSRPGGSTTFQIFLPAIAGTPAKPPVVPPVSQLPRGTGTILVVEDEPPVRNFVCQLLQRLGYAVLQTANGAEALAVWQQHRGKISLVITDIIMPGGMSGYELAAQLLAQEPRLKIIFTSGYTGNPAAGGIALVEGDNFIRKPFEPEALSEIVRQKIAGPAAAP